MPKDSQEVGQVTQRSCTISTTGDFKTRPDNIISKLLQPSKLTALSKGSQVFLASNHLMFPPTSIVLQFCEDISFHLRQMTLQLWKSSTKIFCHAFIYLFILQFAHLHSNQLVKLISSARKSMTGLVQVLLCYLARVLATIQYIPSQQQAGLLYETVKQRNT